MSQSPFAIETQELTKYFGKHPAVVGLNLQVPQGLVFGFLGRNGAGKTTTIGMLLGLLRPTQGQAWMLGHEIHHSLRPALRRTGVLLDHPAFYPYLSGHENLWVVAQALGGEALTRIPEALATVEMSGRASDRFSAYSAGMKQRLGLAAALLNDPDLLVLDEPTTGLDPVGQRDIRDLVRRLASDGGKTVFFSSHQLREVEQICDQVAVIDRGRLVVQGPLAEVAAGRDLETLFMELARGVTVEETILAQSVALILIIGLLYTVVMAVILLLTLARGSVMRPDRALVAGLVAMLSAGTYIGVVQCGAALSRSPLGPMVLGLGFLALDWFVILLPTVMMDEGRLLLTLGRLAPSANSLVLANGGEILRAGIQWPHLSIPAAVWLLIGLAAGSHALAVLIARRRDA